MVTACLQTTPANLSRLTIHDSRIRRYRSGSESDSESATLLPVGFETGSKGNASTRIVEDESVHANDEAI